MRQKLSAFPLRLCSPERCTALRRGTAEVGSGRGAADRALNNSLSLLGEERRIGIEEILIRKWGLF